ncbi:hypothetical protein N0V90_005212 [Kalmusia sp. IMI 367209]|nr:hypothetical protein N0V90_005212 [Kalmusia sp. IMI 367209]
MSSPSAPINDEWKALVPPQLRARAVASVFASSSAHAWVGDITASVVRLVSAPEHIRKMTPQETSSCRYGGTQNRNVALACESVGWEVLAILIKDELESSRAREPSFDEVRAFSNFWNGETIWGRFDVDEVRPGQYDSLLMVTGNLRNWLQHFPKPELFEDSQPGLIRRVRERNEEVKIKEGKEKMKISNLLG